MLPKNSFDNVEEQDAQSSCNLWTFMRDDGRAARSHLAMGNPIYYCDDRFEDELIREWPDGRKELVHVSVSGEIVRVVDLPRE